MKFFVVVAIALLLSVQAKAQMTIEQQMAESRLQQQQLDAQTDSLRLQNQIMQLQMQIDRDRPREKSIYEIIGENRAKQAADDAAARAESERVESAAIASARSSNSMYLAVAISLPLLLVFFIVRKSKLNGGSMKYEEKFGVLLMIAAFLLGLLALSISENWTAQFDLLQNLMITLKIRLFHETESVYSPAMIDVDTKHVLLGLLFVAAYGFTTYVGITPVWKKSDSVSSESTDPAP